MRSKLKALGLITTAFILAFSLFLPQAEAGYQGSSLEDEIQEMIDEGYMQGYPDGTFRHTDSITRAEFTLILDRLLELPDADETAPFSDLPGRQETVDAISSANEAGIIRGYDDNTFRPDEKIQRQQMAAMIERALEYEELGDLDGTITVPDFPDKSEISPRFTDEVDYIASLGIIRGYGDLTFRPQQSAERGHAAAFMFRMITVMELGAGLSDDGQPEKNEGTFQVASINSDGEISVTDNHYDTFEEAIDNMENSDQLILNNGEIVRMNEGIVRPKHLYTESNNVDIYKSYNDGFFSDGMTYVSANHNFSSELQYQESNDVYTKVSIAGATGYVRTDHVELIPEEKAPITKRNYYRINSNGELWHHLYNQKEDQFTSYRFGFAPDFLETGERYLSEDGATFYTSDGEKKGTAYQYFNRLNMQSESSYSAEELEDYIERFAVRNDTDKPTLLLGMGEYFEKYEEEYGINATYMLAVAAHESAFGNSRIAHNRNNLFGIGAYDFDADGNAIPYDSPQDSIEEFANTYMKLGYANANHSVRFRGAAAGNKAVGANVKYASDMFWGQKVAGHMYRIDKELEGEDFGKYDLVETTASGLNVRETPDSRISSNIYYNYSRANMPLIRYGSETAHNGIEWYEVTADHPDYDRGLIHSDYIRTIPIAE